MEKNLMLLLAGALTLQPLCNAMEAPTTNFTEKLTKLNRQATFLYEQSFFFELLSAIILTRRPDNFHADVLFARDQVRTAAGKALQNNTLPFDVDSPPHEQFTLANMYYAFKYLTEQKHYRQFAEDYNLFKTDCRLAYMEQIWTHLNKFAACPAQERMQLLSQIKDSLEKILHCYTSKKDDCLLADQYWRTAILLHTHVMTSKQIHFLFHAYIKEPIKILPPALTWNEDPPPSCFDTRYMPIDLQTLPEIQESPPQQKEGSPCSLFKKIKSTLYKHPHEPPSHISIDSQKGITDIGNFIFLYDFLEYWLARISPLLDSQHELCWLAPQFTKSFQDNLDALQEIKHQISHYKDPHHNIETTSALCRTLLDNFIGIQTKQEKRTLYAATMKNEIATYVSNRHHTHEFTTKYVQAQEV